jgi:cytochrome c
VRRFDARGDIRQPPGTGNLGAGRLPSHKAGRQAFESGAWDGVVMSDLRVNTIAGAVLGSLIVVVTLGIIAGDVFQPEFPEKPGYDIDISSVTGGSGGGGAPVKEGPVDWNAILSDPTQVAAGEKVVTKCKSCHDFTKGGPNQTGPNQWNLVGRTAGTHPGFTYSAAMKAFGQPWTYDNLDKFITNPASFIKGTNMAFVGVKKAEDRHALIAYLRMQADKPAPIPPPLPPQAPDEAASATPPAPG